MASLQLSISLEALDSSKKFNSFCYGRASVVNSLNRVNAIKVSRLQSELPVDENLVEQNLDCSRHENEKGHSNTKKMSTFTMVHHTAPHIPFKSADEWNAAQAQLNGTVRCDYPSWIEILCHDINVHIPHHISPRIPSYNLRAAHKSIQENWGKYLNEATWNWRLMKTIMTVCHVYSKEQNLRSF